MDDGGGRSVSQDAKSRIGRIGRIDRLDRGHGGACGPQPAGIEHGGDRLGRSAEPGFHTAIRAVADMPVQAATFRFA
ncbi:hypothetical protein MBLL_01747 (plasmid) [Methylobacterium bullatum]|uniref:Uncharacterized protein n=1 Tax=Methylobacterium bullatum TaxID=570505 RepID=A0A679JPR5_9HYPH|nr:hypothetical protein MBLL_01747 [Methylobacterium bullatum]